MDALDMDMDVAPVTGDAAEELRWFWNDQEAAAGFRSLHGETVNKQAGLTVDPRAHSLESREVWDSHVGWQAWATREALTNLSRDQVQVLYAAFGPRNPAARIDVLDELTARVAPYTPIVSEVRGRRARQRAEMRTAAAQAEMELRVARRDKVVAAAKARFDAAHVALSELGVARKTGQLSAEEKARQEALLREVQGAVRAMEQANRGVLDEDAMRRVARSHEQAAFLQVGWADALNLMLGARLEPEKGESEEAFAFRRKRWHVPSDQIKGLVAQVRELLDDALLAYTRARQEIV